MLANYVTSLIRTFVPIVVGWAISLPVAQPVLDALSIDTPTATKVVEGALIGVLSTAYYALARVLEQKWPALTVLLGSTRQPVAYQPAATDPANADAVAAVVDPHAALPPDVAADLASAVTEPTVNGA